jgi:hypothetical protein
LIPIVYCSFNKSQFLDSIQNYITYIPDAIEIKMNIVLLLFLGRLGCQGSRVLIKKRINIKID